MSPYNSSPHGYQGLHSHSPAANDLQLPTHHALPPPSPSYPYDSQSVPQLQSPSPYANGQNGHGEGQARLPIPVNTPPSASASGGEGQKANRLRKACDSCSVRKVKCDESGIPCRACAALEIPCTFDRPSRRRGPPNRHAEAIKNNEASKKRRIGSPNGPGGMSSPTSPNNIAETLVSFSSGAVLNAESICSLTTLELLIDDFFTYIHPLCPFPHEPSFRSAFAQRQDLSIPSYLALLASMVGVLVASFPRRPRLHLKASQSEHLFPNSISFVEKCHNIATQARGAGYLDNPSLNVYDAITSYFLGLSGAYTFKWKQTRLYFGETLTILRVIGAHRAKNFIPYESLQVAHGGMNGFEQPETEKVDYIKQELGRRVFWVMFVGIRSMQQIGGSFGELLIPPPTKTEPYPPLPLEVDDEYIFEQHVQSQPPGSISKLTAFNLNCQIFETVTPLATMELAYGIDSVFDINKQKQVMEGCLRAVKKVLNNVPRELMLQPGSQAGEFATSTPYYPPTSAFAGMRVNGNDSMQNTQERLENRRLLQFEIQKANIYASQLGTRSFIVEKYWNLETAHDEMMRNSGGGSNLSSPGVLAIGLDGMIPQQAANKVDEINIANERESVVKDLLQLLGSISQVNMEPNGASFINKIRQIASTLLETPENRKGPMAVRGQAYLKKFLDVLMKLERISPGPLTDSRDPAELEEEELRNWADLRENQMQFLKAGGFLSEI
ncbi:hypothetical protein N431DRAFT_427315 [Stipitochalara longipes BDJ]|nr:hypothetical protein N431DRAFT_427315 [Stipitochalara longipes BDJ]